MTPIAQFPGVHVCLPVDLCAFCGTPVGYSEPMPTCEVRGDGTVTCVGRSDMRAFSAEVASWCHLRRGAVTHRGRCPMCIASPEGIVGGRPL